MYHSRPFYSHQKIEIQPLMLYNIFEWMAHSPPTAYENWWNSECNMFLTHKFPWISFCCIWVSAFYRRIFHYLLPWTMFFTSALFILPFFPSVFTLMWNFPLENFIIWLFYIIRGNEVGIGRKLRKAIYGIPIKLLVFLGWNFYWKIPEINSFWYDKKTGYTQLN